MCDENKSIKIRTGISQAFWYDYQKDSMCQNSQHCERKNSRDFCNGDVRRSTLEPADIKLGINNEESFYDDNPDSDIVESYIRWLDILFCGGITIPNSAKPITFLLTGPPGSGKSTFLLELCYRLANNKIWIKNGNNNRIETNLNPKPYSSLYVSFDTNGESLKGNAKKYGWKNIDNILYAYKKNDVKELSSIIEAKKSFYKDTGLVTILDKKAIKPSNSVEWTISEYIGIGLDVIAKATLGIDTNNIFSKIIPDLLSEENARDRQIKKIIRNIKPKILVLDSLNIVSHKDQKEFFDKLISKLNTITKSNIEIVFLVVDDTSERNNYFDYIADIVMRLDYTTESNYFTRNVEIIKTRYQNHILGKHYFKLSSRFNAENYDTATINGINQQALKTGKESVRNCDINIKYQRSHPYREEGGIFILPSIHYYLSKYRKLTAPPPQQKLEVYPKSLRDIFDLPSGRCTAFVGNRGTHRSHLAYLQLLYHLLKNDCVGLVISLREDEKLTKDTLQRIYSKEFITGNEAYDKQKYSDEEYDTIKTNFYSSKGNIDYFINKNQLEVLHFLPGYITPNEFFHRIFVNSNRLKNKNTDKNLIVVFNSLEQVSPRFPLCAKEDMFISSIIDFFHGIGITAIFVGIDNPLQPIEGYGLLPLSDLVVSFYNYKLTKKITIDSDDFDIGHFYTLLKVAKVAGGFTSGNKGILELNNAGLKFTQLTVDEEEGQKIQII